MLSMLIINMNSKQLGTIYKKLLAEVAKYKLEFYNAKQAYKQLSFSQKRKAKAHILEIRTKLRQAQKEKAHYSKQYKWALQAEGKK